MKKLSLILSFLFFSISVLTANNEQEVASSIKRVTVFRKGAQVSREAKATIAAGNSSIKFTGISPSIDKQSIQLKAEGAFTVLSVNHQINYFEAPEKTVEIEGLEAEKKKLAEQLKRENAVLQVLKEEESLILTNKSIGGQQTGVQISELRATAEFYRSRLTEIKLKKLELEKTITQLKEQQKKIAQQLKEINAHRGTYTSEIVVALNALSSTSGEFLLSYIVKNAGWFPNYDIRVKDIQSPVKLDYKANVYQTSGEEWPNVQLTLSTGNPTQSGTKPTLSPWYLGFYVPTYASYNGQRYQQGVYSGLGDGSTSRIQGKVTDEYGEPLIGANIILEGTSIGTATGIDGNYSIELPYDRGNNRLICSYLGFNTIEVPISSNVMNIVLGESDILLEEVVVQKSRKAGRANRKKDQKKSKQATKPVAVQTVENTTTVEFRIELPYTIPTDGKQRTVNIQSHEIPAYYEYYCAPKIDPDAFLTAQVTDWDDYQLLSGEANLFFEGTFIGKSLLDVDNIEDTLQLSLGRDKNIVVKRTKQKEFSKRQFIGNKKTDSRGWEIEIRNKKKQAINLVLEDQVPVSTVENIEIKQEIEQGGQLSKETGLIEWQMNIPPGQQKKLAFRYEVKYPKKKRVQLE